MTRVYHLYLSTQLSSPASNYIVPITFVDNTSIKSNLTWIVDWDNLFRGNQKNYKRCSVQWALQSNSWTLAATNWETFTGILSSNLASQYGSTTNNGTLLGYVCPSASPVSATKVLYNMDTFPNANGVDINAPTNGVSPLTLMFMNQDTLTTMNTMTYHYQIILQFTLSEPI